MLMKGRRAWIGLLMSVLLMSCSNRGPTTGNTTGNTTGTTGGTSTGAGSILPPGNWKLTLDDEFNGTSVDTNIWVNKWDFAVESATSCVVNSKYLSVSGGFLSLKTFPLSSEPKCDQSLTNAGSSVTSQNAYGPGYFEARVRFDPNGWDSFWTIGGNYDCAGGLTAGFEADMPEFYGGGGNDNVFTGGYASCWTRALTTGVSGGPDDFHIWGLLYDATNGLTFYKDGVETAHLDGPAGTTPLFIKLGNSLLNNSGDTSHPMLVDWVRYYAPQGLLVHGL